MAGTATSLVGAFGPVTSKRMGICEKPADWRWSSFRAIAGLDRSSGFLDLDSVLSLFNLGRQAARAEYVRLVQDPTYQDMCDRADLVRIDGV
jgi:hypothetical protein